MNKLFTVFKGEFKSQFTPGKMVGMFFAIFIPLIPPIVGGDIDHGYNEQGWINNTWMELGRMFSSGVLYTIILRLVSVLKDGTTLDRNRASYLTHSKHKVLTAKLLADAAQFMLTLIIIIVAGTSITMFKNDGKLSGEFYSRSAIFLISMTTLYFLTATTMRWFQYTINNKTMRGLLIGATVLLTVVAYVVLSICLGVIKEDHDIKNASGQIINRVTEYPFQDWVQSNSWISFIPFLNVIMIPQVLFGGVEMWQTVPMIVYTFIFVAIIWRSLASSAKEFLCA